MEQKTKINAEDGKQDLTGSNDNEGIRFAAGITFYSVRGA